MLDIIGTGILTVIIGSIVGAILGKYNSSQLPKICKDWNKNYIMEQSLFLTGVVLHMVTKNEGLYQ